MRSADWQDGARGRAGNAGNENRRCRKEQMVPAAVAALVTSACLGNGFVDSTLHGGSVRTCGALSPKCCLAAANQGAQSNLKWASERRQGEFRGHNAANFALRGGEFLDRTLGRGIRRREQDKMDAVLDCPFSDATGSKYFSPAEEAGSKIDTLSCDPSSLPPLCFHFLAFPLFPSRGSCKGAKGHATAPPPRCPIL